MNNNHTAVERLKQVQGQVAGEAQQATQKTPFPTLPTGACYLFLNNEKKRNALSFAVLQDLRDQLHACNRSPVDGRSRFLPPFDPEILRKLEMAFQRTDSEAVEQYGWLVDSNQWNQHRAGLPRVIILRSNGPIFCSGHDLSEVRNMSYKDVQGLFALCAEVMSLIRRCPVPVIGVVQGLATAAGMQLALTTDLPIAHASTQFRLPGSGMGLGCISPVTTVSRKVGSAFAHRMFALTEAIRADELPGRPLQVVEESIPLDDAVADLVTFYTQRAAGQPQALGKWAYWTQTGFNGSSSSADGYEDAVVWTGKVMALFAQTNDAQEGIQAFLEKRKPCWQT